MSADPMLRRGVPRPFFMLAAMLLVVLQAACSKSYRDPRDMVPADAGAWLVVRPVEEVAKTLGPLAVRVPELAGVLEMVRSVSGIDPTGVDRDTGFDSRRGTMAAVWRDGLLVVLPVSDAGAVRRRLPLKLARFGFTEGDGEGGLREFDSPESGHACLLVKSGLALLFVGQRGNCASLVELLPPSDEKGDEAALQPPEVVERELGVEGSDAVFFVSNRLVAPEVLRVAGLPAKGAAGLVARGFIGDLRGVVRLDGGVSFRIAAGSNGRAFKPSEPSDHPAAPVWIDVTAGPSVRPLLDTALSLAARRFRGLDTMSSLWSGALRVVARADDALGAANRDGFRGNPFKGILRRFDVTAVVGLNRAADGVLDRLGAMFGARSPEGTPPGVAEYSAGGVKFRASVLDSQVLFSTSSKRDEEGDGQKESPGLPVLSDDSRVVSASLSPEGLLEASGFDSIDYLKHLVDPIETVRADVYYQGGRVVVDGFVGIR